MQDPTSHSPDDEQPDEQLEAQAEISEASAIEEKPTTSVEAASLTEEEPEAQVQLAEQPDAIESEEAPPEISVAELGLSPRARDALQGAGISTVSGVLATLAAGEEALIELEGFGPQALAKLKERLQQLGYSLPGEESLPEAQEETELLEAAEEETLPEGPSFGERLQETFASARERLSVALGPLGERLGATFAPLREKMGDQAWIYGLIALVVVLVILALFIPPFSLLQRLGITGYTTLTAETDKNYVEHPDGIRVIVPATYEGKLRVRLDSIPRADFLGFAHSSYRDAVEALPTYLEVKSPFYKILVRGANGQQVLIEVDMPAAAEPWETLDLYTWTGESWEWVGSELDTRAAENEHIRAWVTDIPDNVVAVQAKATTQIISAPLGPEDDLASAASVADEINPTGLAMGTDGIIIGSLAQMVDVNAYTVMPILREPSAHGPLADVLTKPEIQQAHIAKIVEMCTNQGFAGIEIDYRGITTEEREAYTAFISTLADTLHDNGLRVNVVVESPIPAGAGWNTGGYDWKAIGAVADAVKVPFSDDPAAYVEGGEARQLLDWATAQVPRYKLRMQVSSLSVEQRGSETNYISMDEALAPFGEVATVGGVTQVTPNSEVKFSFTGVGSIAGIVPEDAAGTYRIQYTGEGDTTYTVWLGTSASLAVKLQWAQRYHLGGVAINDLFNPGNAPDVVSAVAAYRAATTPPTGQQVEVVWTVTSTAAELDRKTAPLTDPSYTWMVVAATDTYTVKATIAGVERGSLEITVAELAVPTATPIPVSDASAPPISEACLKASFVSETVPDGTKFEKGETFVKSWTLSNSGTCDWPADTALVKVSSQMGGPDSVSVGTVAVGEAKQIEVEMTAPDEDGSFTSKWALKAGSTQMIEVWAIITVGEGGGGAPAPIAPIASGGGFELGGQTHTLANPDAMHRAGMTWVKFQHKWNPGDDPGGVAWKIQAAHANGFKVLLSIPGGNLYPSSIDFSAYTEFLRGVAALGPDAIEIWNEHNLDREWPAGQISPTDYVQKMLAPGYNAIKSVNPNIMVISGAPSPTGAEGAYGLEHVWNDDRYIRGMASAGAANYADCIGVHYNEGIVSPSQTSGDPRTPSDYYTRYFWGMVNTYYNAFGGQRKLCFTELGYLSPEGYGALPASFAWAQNTSVDEHATWLAEAASLSASSGKVRLMIVFSVDIFHWDDKDPQSGYAIIRADGSCPACDKLKQVMNP